MNQLGFSVELREKMSLTPVEVRNWVSCALSVLFG